MLKCSYLPTRYFSINSSVTIIDDIPSRQRKPILTGLDRGFINKKEVDPLTNLFFILLFIYT